MQKYSVSIQGHRTSITLELEFWNALKKMAEQKSMSVAKLIEHIDSLRNPVKDSNLSSFIRLYLFNSLNDKNS